MKQPKLAMNFDLNERFAAVQAQFRGLNPKQPGQWPLAPKIATWVAAGAAVVVAAWMGVLTDVNAEIEQVRAEEGALKEDYRGKLAQAINLDALKAQKEQVQGYVSQLEKQLPGKAEMDALLSDINQAGLGRGLQFELFRPGNVVVKDYYAELPITIRVSGRYADVGTFAADVANLSRIVSLHDVVLLPQGKEATGPLTMDATARTYRYLDAAEVMQARKAAKGKDGKDGKDNKESGK